ncbi:hypothetical protein [Hymenobacter edaphi]|uniref:Uncharacterized protein n=1 Tax=Hymenobacter edaphi TaxID=2211146 RepID=A0A328BWL4_9BACT|nr:hypothetical protein [Hymenobacter edaphi]RAK70456.1 hypothetical protein DLM85_06380 [Hymenobacter edaphi]
MPIPTVHEFAAALHASAADAESAELAVLSNPLLTAFEEVKSFRPLSVRLVKAPWEGTALAFEASWPDTHALVVAARVSAEHGTSAQLMLRRAGQTIYAVNSTPEQLATDVAQCLGRHIRYHHAAPAAAPAPSPDVSPAQSA